MKNKNLLLSGTLLMIVLATIISVSCNKKFDEPPTPAQVLIDTSISNHLVSVKDLKAKHSIGGLEQITDNVILKVTVSADDKSGNFYKSLAVQDATGGISLKLDRSNLYIDYPEGRVIYIKCQGLYISDYNHSIDLGVLDNSNPGSPLLGSIPSVFFETYITKYKLGDTVTIRPKVVTLAQLKAVAALTGTNIITKDTLQNVLIQVNDVELATSDVGYIYSDTSAAKKTVSRKLTDCIGTTGVVLYTGGYSDFASLKIPTGKGSLTGIYTPYNKTAEIIVRDTNDVQMKDTRCGAAVSTSLFSETFPGVTNGVVITTTGSSNVWQNIAEVGGFSYTGYVNTSGTTHMASISGFVAGGAGPAIVKSWLITQAITIPSATNAPALSFVSADGYYAGASFQVLVSTDYNGSSTPSTSTWAVLPATISTGHAKFTTAVPSGAVDLSAYIGKTIYLAWRYTTTTTAQAGTGYEFGTVKVLGY